MKVGYWLAFVAFQVVGSILPFFANVHSNPTPLFIGIVLTLPGGLVAAYLPLTTPEWQQVTIVVSINFVVWSGVFFLLKMANRSSSPKHDSQ